MIFSSLSRASTCASSSEIISSPSVHLQGLWQDWATELSRELSGDSLSTLDINESFWPQDTSLEHADVIALTADTDWSQLPDIPPALHTRSWDPEPLEADALGVWAQDVLGAPDSTEGRDFVAGGRYLPERN